jgi:hypothetical protein
MWIHYTGIWGGPINLLVGESNSTTFAGSCMYWQEDIAGSLTDQATIYGTVQVFYRFIRWW